MYPKIAAAIAFFCLFTSQAPAAYMPDNNGRHVYVDDRASRRAAGFQGSHWQSVRVTREASRAGRRHTRTHESRHHRREMDRHELIKVDANGNRSGYAKVHIANGDTATVIASAADRFQAFIDEVEADQIPDVGAGYFVETVKIKGNRIGEIGCLSSGHMRHSKHHWGGACDFSQLSRDRTTDKFMYHVTAIAHKHGLTDGCEWDNRDCGHIEVPGPNRLTRTASARHHHRRYAGR